MSGIDELYEEYVRDWHAGRVPDSDSFVARAPEPDRAELGRLIETFLLVAPSVEPAPEQVEALQSSPAFLRALAIADAAPPTWGARLRAARENAGLTLRALGARFAASFELAGRDERAAAMLGDLESGALAASDVTTRAADRLAELLGVGSGALRPPPRPAPLFRAEDSAAARLGDLLQSPELHAPAPRAGGAPDELDELLRGG